MLYAAAVNTIRGLIRKATGLVGWTQEEADTWADNLISLSFPLAKVLAKWTVASWRWIGADALADRVARVNGLVPV